MSRYFVPIDKHHLATIILNAFSTYDKEKYDGWKGKKSNYINAILESGYSIPWRNLTSKITSDLKKCEFDTENVDCKKGYGVEKIAGFRTLSNGLTYLGISAGGDWEFPVFHILYFDGKQLRAYIPKDGNPWNTDTKTAYGNDEESDNKNAKKRFDVENYNDACPNSNQIIQDIEERILQKGDKI